jgi:hypothetical protein
MNEQYRANETSQIFGAELAKDAQMQTPNR